MALTLASAFLTRWSSSAFKRFWTSSALLRSVMSWTVPRKTDYLARAIPYGLAARRDPDRCPVAERPQVRFISDACLHRPPRCRFQPFPIISRITAAKLTAIVGGWCRGIKAINAKQLVRPNEHIALGVPMPAADAGHTLRLSKLSFSMLQPLLRLFALVEQRD